ncbi:zinc finger protein 845-like [Sabethes cyaneus]|uniref:zinc finger protein 845-like n=1 Tax=Sabethes cyaneus TaxID=53552 RepID=UPI00237DCC7F|nr:zinc finger protein 845-like [Sabethes cyaneus]
MSPRSRYLNARYMRKYRKRKKEQRLALQPRKQPKSTAERVRAYRAKMKAIKSASGDSVPMSVKYSEVDPYKCTICYQDASKITPIECNTDQKLCDRCLLDLLTRKFESDTASDENDTESFNVLSSIKEEPLDEDNEPENAQTDHQSEMCILEFSAGVAKVEIEEPDPVEPDPVEQPQESIKFKCNFCDEGASTRKALGQHIALFHMEEKKNQCHICKQFFKDVGSLEEHAKSDHGGFTHACDICTECYHDDEKLIHESNCQGRLVLECAICQEGFVLKESLWKHLDGHELTEENKAVSFRETRKTWKVFTCVICNDGRAFDEKSFWPHVHDKHDGYHLKCKECGRTFRKQLHLFMHISQSCQIDVRARKYAAEHPKLAVESQCPHCPKRYSSITNLNNHISKIHTALPIVCHICGHAALNKKQLRYHMIKAHTEPTEQCSHCPKAFHRLGDLRQHLLTHETVKKFVCAVCGAVFKRKLGLDAHIRSHQMTQRPRYMDAKQPKSGPGAERVRRCRTKIKAIKIRAASPADSCNNGSGSGDFESVTVKGSEVHLFKCTICDQNAFKVTPIECNTDHKLCDRCLLDLLTRKFESDTSGDENDTKSFNVLTSIKEEPLDEISEPENVQTVHQPEVCVLEFSPGVAKVETEETDPVKQPPESIKFKCSFCDEGACTRKALGVHITLFHPEEKKNQCHICKQFFKGVGSLEAHAKSVHGGFSYACDICTEGYHKEEKLIHESNCLGRLVLECAVCQEGFVLKEGLWKHLDGHELTEENKALSFRETRKKWKVFTCLLCSDDRAFDEKSYLRHIHYEHDGYHLKCKDCGKQFRKQMHLSVHIREHCKIGARARKYVADHPKLAVESQCPHCPKRYTSAAYLNGHITRIHKALPVVCDICGHTAFNKERLQYHMVKAHTEPTEQCPHCPKAFHLLADLQQHLITHDTAKKFVCAECGAVFKRKLGLDTHTRSHQKFGKVRKRTTANETAKFRCDTCGKRFKHNYLLLSHMHIHDPNRHVDKKHSCLECGKTFTTKAGVYYHMKQKFVHQQITCTVCSLLIKGRERYLEHLRLHSQKPA